MDNKQFIIELLQEGRSYLMIVPSYVWSAIIAFITGIHSPQPPYMKKKE